MVNLYNVKSVFKFFLKKNIRAPKNIVFALLSLLPPAFIILAKVLIAFFPESGVKGYNLFSDVSLFFYFQILIQIITLIYGTSVIKEEIDSKTLVYSGSLPLKRRELIYGKYAAYFSIVAVLVLVPMILSLWIADFQYSSVLILLKKTLLFTITVLLSISAYLSFFTLAGTVLRKTAIPGLLFCFGWEKVTAYIPGFAGKLTIFYYIKNVLLNIKTEDNFLLTLLYLGILALITVISFFLSAGIFEKREYVLGDSN